MACGLTRFTGEAFTANQAVVRALAAIGEELSATPAQVALAWLRAHRDALGLAVVPIPGTRRRDHVNENAASVDVHLTEEQVRALDAVSLHVIGERSDFDDPNWTSDTRERSDDDTLRAGE